MNSDISEPQEEKFDAKEVVHRLRRPIVSRRNYTGAPPLAITPTLPPKTIENVNDPSLTLSPRSVDNSQLTTISRPLPIPPEKKPIIDHRSSSCELTRLRPPLPMIPERPSSLETSLNISNVLQTSPPNFIQQTQSYGTRTRAIHTIVPTIINTPSQANDDNNNNKSSLFTTVNLEGTTILSMTERTTQKESTKASNLVERQNNEHHHAPNVLPKYIHPVSQPNYYLTQDFLEHLEMVKIQVLEEFKAHGPALQFKRDAKLWKLTLEEPEVPQLGDILKRIFTILRWGGFLYRSHEKSPADLNPNDIDPTRWRWWHESGLPIASALSHGSRIIIQLPKKQHAMNQQKQYEDDDGYGIDDYLDPNDKDDHCHAFWKWLITGNPKGDLTKYVSTATSGNEARRTGRLLFKRLGATHALQYQNQQETAQQTNEIRASRRMELEALQQHQLIQSSLMSSTVRSSQQLTPMFAYQNTPKKKLKGSTEKFSILPGGRRKVLLETKTVGITFRDTKMFRADEHVLKHHRHWGMNLPVGGAGYQSLTGAPIECNGEHGHMYIYYMSPKYDRFGGLMIGVEGSEYGKYDQGGGYHGLSARSPLFSPTFGYKWRGKDKGGDSEEIKPDLGDIGPSKYNGMLVDLTGSGWTFLMDKEREWKNEYVAETSCPVEDIVWPESDPFALYLKNNPVSVAKTNNSDIENVTIEPLSSFMGLDPSSDVLPDFDTFRTSIVATSDSDSTDTATDFDTFIPVTCEEPKQVNNQVMMKGTAESS
jgi:hypothetical protein